MSTETTRLAVETLFQSEMAAHLPEVTILYQNADSNAPQGLHVSLWLMEGRAHEANIGNRTVDRHVGVVQVTVAMPVRTGTSKGNQIADFVGLIFRNKQIRLEDGALLRFRIPSNSYQGDVGGYAHVTVRIPYWRDEVAR